jgi:Asparagine synthase
MSGISTPREADLGAPPPLRASREHGRSSEAIALTALERACGRVFGAAAVGEALVLDASNDRAPREALTECVVDALRHPPCVVSFSGGWDSSAVLAIAVAAAREHGLAPPIPVTLRFADAAGTEESAWQELVIAHLGLTDWEVVHVGSELELLGEVAQAGLAEHGLLWPANAHMHVPVFQRARGGRVLTGLDGDGLLGGWRWQRSQAVLHRRMPLTPRGLRAVGLAASPVPVKRRRLSQTATPSLDWTAPTHRRVIARALTDEQGVTQPRQWRRYLEWYARRRYLAVGLDGLDLLARDHGVTVTHPLIDHRHLGALGHDGRSGGYGSRRDAMVHLFGDLLPPALLARRTKALFDEALWGPHARAFAAEWDGRGLDQQLVDHDALRAAWRRPSPPLAAATLLQEAWLAAQQGQPNRVFAPAAA